MAADDSALLPKVPPPRPAARTSAIDAALRRFDGIEEAPAPVRPVRGRWGWGRHPQMGLAVSASLVAVIGIPAALIAILDQAPPPPAPVERAATPAAEPKVRAKAQPIQAEGLPDAAPKPSAGRPEPNRFPVLPDDAALSGIADRATPQAVVAAAPPGPPPPAPVAQAGEQQAMAADNSVVVTGSRIQRPSLVGERSENKALGAVSNEDAAAPDWVRRDPTYRTFLQRLQAAIRSDQRNAIAGLIAYPLRVNSGGTARSYRNAAEVLRDFDQIFTPAVKAAILSQRFENLFGRDQGVMIGNGAVWFDHSCRGRACDDPGPVRIIAINP